MTEAADRLNFCKQALGEIGTRSTITSLDPPDASPEAFYCNLFFTAVRDQVLRAAHWSFAGRTNLATLWKARVGTPENPASGARNQWSSREPARPWLYSYIYPTGYTIQVRRVRSQDDQEHSPLLFHNSSAVPFEVAADSNNAAGNPVGLTQSADLVTIVSGGTGYQPGDFIVLQGGGGVYGNPLQLAVNVVSSTGAVTQAFPSFGGSFSVAATGTMTQLSTTGEGTGFTCTATFVPFPDTMKVILTDAPKMIFDFTTSIVNVSDYDAGFGDAFMLALEGKLALALLGDQGLYKAKLQEANNVIIDARVRDGNEGLTTYDHVPDWLQVRGVSSMTAGREWFNPPYGPLFPV